VSEELTDPDVRRSDGEQDEGADGPEDAQPLARRPSSPSTRGPGPDFAEKVARTRPGHPEGCRCTRCVGFTPGPNGTAVTGTTHGARSWRFAAGPPRSRRDCSSGSPMSSYGGRSDTIRSRARPPRART
jgi:hypothetical protein